MNHCLVAVAAATSVGFSSVPISAKDKVLAEPSFESVFHELSDSSQIAIMPRENPVQETKVKALGYGGGRSYIMVDGEHCAYQIVGKVRPTFIVRVPSQKTDPHDYIQFFRLEVAKGKRRFEIARAGAYSVGKSTLHLSQISFTARAYGASSVSFTPEANLVPGEYLLSTTTSPNSYCFAIR